MNFEGFTRREFIKITGLATAGIVLGQGCATFDPNKDWSQVPADKFDIKSFDRWFKWNKLYNGVNPNLKWPHSGGHNSTFRANVFCPRGSTPGVDYNVPWGEVMVASAPGEVMDFYELHTGRAGGKMVKVGHPHGIRGWHFPIFESYYAHLDKVYVKIGQMVKRGDPIGNVTEHNNYAKLIFKETNNYADPDNHGFNHNYMNYAADQIDKDEDHMSNYKLMDKIIFKQRETLDKFDRYRTDRKENMLIDFKHVKSGSRQCSWSPVEKFRYLEELYKVKPDLFPNLSKDQFESMKKEFYDNQPIILTLPLVKGGMKKY